MKLHFSVATTAVVMIAKKLSAVSFACDGECVAALKALVFFRASHCWDVPLRVQCNGAESRVKGAWTQGGDGVECRRDAMSSNKMLYLM